MKSRATIAACVRGRGGERVLGPGLPGRFKGAEYRMTARARGRGAERARGANPISAARRWVTVDWWRRVAVDRDECWPNSKVLLVDAGAGG